MAQQRPAVGEVERHPEQAVQRRERSVAGRGVVVAERAQHRARGRRGSLEGGGVELRVEAHALEQWRTTPNAKSRSSSLARAWRTCSPACSAAARASASRRLLPIPAGPSMTTTRPVPPGRPRGSPRAARARARAPQVRRRRHGVRSYVKVVAPRRRTPPGRPGGPPTPACARRATAVTKRELAWMSTWRSGPSPVLRNAWGTPGGTTTMSPARGLELLVAEGVARLALLHDADLGVVVPVQRRAAAGRRLHEDERHTPSMPWSSPTNSREPPSERGRRSCAMTVITRILPGHRVDTRGPGPVHCRRWPTPWRSPPRTGPRGRTCSRWTTRAARSCSGTGRAAGWGRRTSWPPPAPRAPPASRWPSWSSRTASPDGARRRRRCSSTPPGAGSGAARGGPAGWSAAGHGRALVRGARRLPYRRRDRLGRRALPGLPAASARSGRRSRAVAPARARRGSTCRRSSSRASPTPSGCRRRAPPRDRQQPGDACARWRPARPAHGGRGVARRLFA